MLDLIYPNCLLTKRTGLKTDDQGQGVQLGEIGEIVHCSPQLLLGYFNDEEKTQQAFAGDWFHGGT